MSGFKHTKGLWSHENRGPHVAHHINDKHGLFVASVGSTGKSVDENSANARLIAAAPEMLDILISFCDGNCGVMGYCEESKCHDTCALREAKDIVERATGLTIGEAIVEWQSEDRK